MRMRILLITDNHTPTGGAERYFFQLKEKLKNTPGNHVFSIGFAKQHEHGEDFVTLPAPNSKIEKLIWRLLPNKKVAAQLRQLIEKINPDVIHIHNIKQYTPTILNIIKPYPSVQTIHDHGIICPTAQNLHRNLIPCETGIRLSCLMNHRVKFSLPIYWLMLLAFYRNRYLLKQAVNAYICPSPLLADYLRLNHFPNVSHISLFKEETHSITPLDTSQRRFLFAGKLAPHKGISILIKEFIMAAQQNHQLSLDIIGDGPEEENIQGLVAKAGLSARVRFHGWQPDPSPYFEHAYAFLFPSIGLEGFPLVLMEAMVKARPIIGVKRGITEWIIDNHQTGLLFDPLTTGDLAQKILYLAEHPDEAIAMGKAGQAKLEGLVNNEAALDQTLGVYREVIAKHQPQQTHTEAAV